MSLSYELDGAVAVVQLDDGKVNAFSHELLEELAGVLARAESEAAAMVIEGRPGRFSAGFDLATMTAGDEAMRGLLSAGTGVLLDIFASPIPIVAACSGHAIAAGALTLLVADHRIGVSGNFKIGLNEVAIGIRLPLLALELARYRLIPSAVDQALLGELVDPETAWRTGYLDAVVEPELLAGAARAAAARFAELERSAFARSKALAREAVIERIRATLADDLATLSGPAGSP